MKTRTSVGVMILGVAWAAGCANDALPTGWEVDEPDARTLIDASRDVRTGSDTSDPVLDMGVDVGPRTPAPLDWSALGPAEQQMCRRDSQTRCVPRDPMALGDCGQALGYVFDGRQCVEATGCPCEGDEPCGIFETASACAASCAADGWCQQGKYADLGRVELECTGHRCYDFMMTCVDSDDDPGEELIALTDGQMFISCREGQPNDLCAASPGDCGPGRWCCQVGGAFITVPPEAEEGFCALTLMPDVMGFGCIDLE